MIKKLAQKRQQKRCAQGKHEPVETSIIEFCKTGERHKCGYCGASLKLEHVEAVKALINKHVNSGSFR